jgi:hypothetical protein
MFNCLFLSLAGLSFISEFQVGLLFSFQGSCRSSCCFLLLSAG